MRPCGVAPHKADGIISALPRRGSTQDFPMTPTLRMAALLALALAWPLTHAQATKSLGNGKPGGKLLTRDELRACLGGQQDLKARRVEIERERAELDRDKAALLQAGEALKNDREAHQRSTAEQVSAFNAKNAAHGERVAALGQRIAALAELQKQRDKRDEAQRERETLENERQELLKEEDALKAQAKALNQGNADAVAAFNARAAEHDRKVQAWNERNRAAVERAQTWQDENSRWSADCADRRYNEDDEIAIKRGK
jgi:hypothetical protein